MKTPAFWTIQVFPEGGGDSHSLRLRPRALYLTLALFAVLAGLSSAWVLGVLGERDAIQDVTRYRTENRHLVRSLAAMEQRTLRLSRALDDLAARDQRFRLVAGLPLLDPEVYSVGVGGPVAVDSAQERFYEASPALARTADDVTIDLDQLLRRAELLSSSLREAVDSVESHRDLFRRRPAIYPVVAADAWVSSGFSHSRLHPVLGYRRPHAGVDISAAEGSPVVATGAGRVTFAGTDRGYGKMVEIDHGGGYKTRYAHLARVLVRSGASVDRGGVIGEVGRSGLTTGPNLHYEILVDDRPVNPWNYLLDDSYRR
ncbi:MAG: M23 family metallopeptidase [Gemmatimonadota bacterium]